MVADLVESLGTTTLDNGLGKLLSILRRVSRLGSELPQPAEAIRVRLAYVDRLSLLYRSYRALLPLLSSLGRNTNQPPVTGFMGPIHGQ